MAKYIKNTTNGNKTWVGQLISSGDYYEIQSHEEVQWANDSTLLTDIGSGDAAVAKDASGNTDITDTATAINFLKDLLPNPVSISTPFAEANGFKARWKGFKGTALKNSTTDIDFAIGAEDRYINGGSILLVGAAEGDTFCYQIVDKDNIFGYGAGVVLDEFVKDWQVDPTVQNQGLYETTFLARIYAGLYIRVKYTSVSTILDVTVKLNLLLNKKT